ncbi:MAG: hypothetical protein BIFFINMI_02522 [Phycisphaerae bacterium]|nr:hypothetical protein [Phycisphaerae bacterium]
MNRTAVIAVIATVTAGLAGCIVPETDKGRTVISPNGSMKAYPWIDRLWLGIPNSMMLGKVVAERLSVRWGPGDSLWSETKTQIPTQSLPYSIVSADAEAALFFSPDSKHLAVVVQMNVVIVDLATGKTWGVAGRNEDMAGFSWLSADEVGYVTRIRTDGGTYLESRGFVSSEDRFDVSYWRQGILPGAMPRLVRRLEKVDGPLSVRPYCLTYPWPIELTAAPALTTSTQPEEATSFSSSAVQHAVCVEDLGLLPDSVRLWVVSRSPAMSEDRRPRILHAELDVDGVRQTVHPTIEAFPSKFGWSEQARFPAQDSAKSARVVGVVESNGKRFTIVVPWVHTADGWKQGPESVYLNK